jgi:uncharacterized protein YbjT (DUF2867 family)
MSELGKVYESAGPVKGVAELQELAQEFDKLSGDREWVIPPHQERPEAFRWFVQGALFERRRRAA